MWGIAIGIGVACGIIGFFMGAILPRRSAEEKYMDDLEQLEYIKCYNEKKRNERDINEW